MLNILFLACALTALILTAIDHARREAREQERIAETRKAQEERDEQLRSLGENVRKLLAFVTFPQGASPLDANKTAPTSSGTGEFSLKERTGSLAGELLHFAQWRGPHMDEGNVIGLNASDLPTIHILGNPPTLSEIDTWAKESARQYGAFMTAYYTEFSSKVILLCNELAIKGILDDNLNKLCRDPVSPAGVRKLGERMAKVAEKLR
jgi:hypothetical protein